MESKKKHLLTSNFFLLTSFLLAIVGCSGGSSQGEVEVKVRNIGMLREIMHQGKYEARVAIDTLDKTNLYAVGALETLSGELTIINGEVFATKVQDDSIHLISDEEAKATLFVFAQVMEWDTLTIDSSDDLEQTITEIAESRNYDKPFPFLVKGSPNSTVYHVINFDPVNGDISKHKEGAKYDTLTNETVQLLGFYAANAKGVYTHHTTNMHVHLVNETGTKSGHLEEVDLTNQSFHLLIPKP